MPGATPTASSPSGSPSTSPGSALKAGDGYTGFDIDTAVYIAGALGVPADNITWKEANGDERHNCWSPGRPT